MVEFYLHGKKRSELVAEYDLTPSVPDSGIKKYQQSGSFKAKDNRSNEQNELIALYKQNKQLFKENDILKASGADNGTKIVVLQASQRQPTRFMSLSECFTSVFYYQRKDSYQHPNINAEKYVITLTFFGLFIWMLLAYSVLSWKVKLY